MNTIGPLANLLLSALAAGLGMFELLAQTGVHEPLPMAAGIAGAIGICITQHLRQLPRREWSDEKREEKTGIQP